MIVCVCDCVQVCLYVNKCAVNALTISPHLSDNGLVGPKHLHPLHTDWSAAEVRKYAEFELLSRALISPFVTLQFVALSCVQLSVKWKEKDNIKRGIWALGDILFGALIFPAHHAVGLNRFSTQLHITLIDECINILLST